VEKVQVDKIISDEDLECLDSRTMVEALDKFADTFQASARRWEIIVYPAMLAFIILAAYGFYLIYSLTTNVTQVTKYMANVTQNMEQVSSNMQQVTHEMTVMSKSIQNMSGDTGELTSSITNMNHQIYTMNQNIAIMTGSMNRMGTDMGQLNRSIGEPADFMNQFIPW
jgi:uncharacterized protein YoxC